MAEPDLLGMYGASTPARDEAARRQQQAAMSHAPPSSLGIAAYGGSTGAFAPPPAVAIPSDAEQQALVEEAQRGQAALEAAPAVDPTTQALEGNYTGSLGRTADAFMLREDAKGRLVSSPNKKRPFVEREAAHALAGNLADAPPQPEPFAPPMRDPSESDAAYSMRVQLAQEAYDVDNALAMQEWEARRPAARDVGRSGNIGSIENERRQDEEMAALQTEQVERLTALETDHARATADAYGQMREANRERQERQRMSEQAIKVAQDTERAVRQKLDAMPAANASKFTDDMGAGGIITALLGGLALGFAGQPGAMAQQLADLNARSLDEQKLNFDLGIQAHADARDGVGQAMDVYQTIRNGIQDEEAADLMYMNFRDEQYAALLNEEMALTTEPQAKLEIQQTLSKLEEQRVARAEQLKYKLATTPESVVGRVGADPKMQALAEKLILGEADHRRGMEMKQVDVAEGRREQEGKMDVERLKVGADRAKEERQAKRDVYKESGELADKIAEKQGIVSQLQSIKDEYKDGIPGAGALPTVERGMEWVSGATGGTDEHHVFRKKVWNAIDRVMRERTGAVAPPEDVEAYTNSILEGAEGVGGEARVMSNLDALINSYAVDVEVHKRGRSPEAQAHLTNNADMAPDDAIDIGTASKRDVVKRK